MIHHGPDYVAINQALHRPVIAHRASPFLRGTMYVLQVADAIISANGFEHQGMKEMNPMMRPFSHGGLPMMLVGFGLGDVLHHIVMRKASAGEKNTANALQAASNVEGIVQSVQWEARFVTVSMPSIR